MSRFSGQVSNSKQKPRTGVLVTNLGSPGEPTPGALRRYLAEFLSDPRVVEIPRLVWLIILHGIILRVRPAKSAKLYQSIWTEQGAPLVVITQKQKDKIAARLTEQYGDDVLVDFAMRYGKPSIASALQKFQQAGVDNIIVLPLYPQYAGPTTGSTFDAVTAEVKRWRWVPSLHFLSSYHDNPGYIDALANTVREHIAAHGKPDKLVLSYHGMPKAFQEWGDPYYDFCDKTTQLLVAELGLGQDDYLMTFQSRFGKAEWLQPYTDVTLESLPEKGDKHIAIMSPAFSADCLETLEELESENREIFMEAGGEKYHYIAALNDRDDHIEMLTGLVNPLITKR
ncbi:ferrochelatase [Thalassomonas viridans]|uniref:Ferrochelatase n=1 Tax=Thalassomonas viridans TaxID=137584 RepID=A0AAE9Z2Y6_9GAMM|nr:ferrochelatase [Thalassomonas viridans]WDE05816.1 ferrochelatase [Thalassomonas viridans]